MRQPFNHDMGKNGNNKNGYNCGCILVRLIVEIVIIK